MNPRNLTVTGLLAVLFAVGNESTAATLYVGQDSPNPRPPYAEWNTAAHTIQEAVDASSDGDTVVVGAGEYRLTNQITVAKAILLRSDQGASDTVVAAASEVRGFWISNSVATLDGFTIRDGNTTGAEGGGVFLVGATVQNCVFSRCFAFRGSGGGVYMVGGLLRNSIVTGFGLPPLTVNGGGVYCTSGGVIEDCQIIDNICEFNGGGVYLEASHLRNSVVSRNRGGNGAGVYALTSGVAGCIITNNFSFGGGGGAYLDQSELDRGFITGNRAGIQIPGPGGGVFTINSVVRNSLIAANIAQGGGLGGGAYLQGGSLLNCTVTENLAAVAGGIYVESSAIRNSIVYFNSAPTDANWRNAGGSLEFVCTTPHPGGTGSIDNDPQFVDRSDTVRVGAGCSPASFICAPTNNYHLAPTSPCIDAGINEEWMLGAHDLDGGPRIRKGNAGLVDLGAYENKKTPAP